MGDIEVGAVLEGKVTGITKFGAFVSVAPNLSGLVHISEVASSYVNDIQDHLSEGQSVKVKVMGFDKSGRLNLSIKAALPGIAPRAVKRPPPQRTFTEPSFEDKLKQFMQDSDSKMSGLKQYSSPKGKRRK